MGYSAIRRHRIASRTAGDCRAAVPGAAGVALGASGADVGAPPSTRNWPQTPAPALAEVLQHGSATVRDYRGYLLIWSAAPSAPCHRGLFAAMATYSDISSHPNRQDRQGQRDTLDKIGNALGGAEQRVRVGRDGGPQLVRGGWRRSRPVR